MWRHDFLISNTWEGLSVGTSARIGFDELAIEFERSRRGARTGAGSKPIHVKHV